MSKFSTDIMLAWLTPSVEISNPSPWVCSSVAKSLTSEPSLFASGQIGNGATWGAQDWGWLGIILSWVFFYKETRWLHAQKCEVLSNPVLLGVMMFLTILLLSFTRTFIYFRF